MRAVILAAGRGKRLGDLTRDIPKPLLKLNNKPIIRHIIDVLPAHVNEIIIVLGYLGEKIREELRDHSDVIFVEQIMSGTAGALWSAKPLLSSEKFLVINADDIYGKGELDDILGHDRAMGLFRGKSIGENFLHIELGRDDLIKDFIKPENVDYLINLATGAYILDYRIFGYELVRLSSGEYGLPQTILKMSKDIPVRGVFIERWHPINTPEQFNKAEKALLNKQNLI